MLKPSRLTAAPPLRSGRLPFQGSLREPTNSAHNLSPSTRSEPFGSNKHRTDRLWQCQRQRLRRGERQAKISSVNSLNYPRPPSAVYSLNPVESGMRMNSLSSVSPTTSGGSGTTAQEVRLGAVGDCHKLPIVKPTPRICRIVQRVRANIAQGGPPASASSSIQSDRW